MNDNRGVSLELLWYAVHVRSKHEFQVQERLHQTDVEVFLPVVEKLSKWKDRRKRITFPLFPGYLFVRIDRNSQEKRAVLKTKGVVRVLCTESGEPEPVPDDQIASLRRLIDSGVPLDPHPYLKEGRRVRIRTGPLSGVEGILVQRLGLHILVLSVDILHQGASLRIDASDVETI